MSEQAQSARDWKMPNGVQHIVDDIRRLRASTKKLPPERELASLLDVKRHQLRKALNYLRQINELEHPAPRESSTALTRYSDELVRLTNPLEVIELRMIVEPGLARLASLRASPRDMSRITEAANTPLDASSSDIDLSFHCAVADAARNDLAREFYKMIRQIGVDARVRVVPIGNPSCPRRIAQRDAEHLRIAQAIAERNPDAADAAMRDHLQSVSRQIEGRTRDPRSGLS